MHGELGGNIFLIYYVFKQACGNSLDWVYLKKNLKAMDLNIFAAYMEKLCDIWFGDTQADSDSKLVTDFMADSGMHGTTENRDVIQIAGKNDRSYSQNRLWAQFKIIFPGIKEMKERFPIVGKCPVLFPFFWMVRIFKVLLFEHKKINNLDFRHISKEQCDDIRKIFF